MIVVLALLGLAAIVLQMVLPKVPLMEVRPFLVALPVLYGAMRMGGFRPYYLAIGLGLAIDLLSPQKFGTGALVLSVLVVLVRVQRANFPFDLYGSVALLALLATFGALLLEPVADDAERSRRLRRRVAEHHEHARVGRRCPRGHDAHG